ncbi:hypothetical protein DRN98_05705 [Methanosarcinales archaeon]|uniref:DUF4352 domain-containing protein n=1 Tax=Candidatus Syntropharchaeum caldarium TaxID=1838285 RepID=A0A1F2PAW7_9EURY|nr:MAG: hypothetical protein SCAL_000824 [Candidatus Syntrophoarchaeum caldarius]RLG32143.1 MAG: hypothetical protein DRN98_05705 [Methanosarcinales archaeon]
MKAENVVAVIVIIALAGIVYLNLDREELAPLNNALETGIAEIKYYTNLAIDGFADLLSPLLSNTATKGEYVNTGNLNTTIAECELLESNFAEEGAAYLLALVRVKNVGKVPEHLPLLIDMRLHYLGDVVRPKKNWRCEGGRTHYDPLTTDKIYPNVTREGWICFEVPANMNLSEAVISARCEGRRVKWTGF